MYRAIPCVSTHSAVLRRSSFTAAATCAVGFLSGVPTQSVAADTPPPDAWGGLEEVVVTAQKREESLQSVPLAVTAMGAEQLEALGITSLSRLADAAVPGLTVMPFAGSTSTLTFNMRGVSTVDPTAGLADSGVAVYSDGIVLSRAYGTGLDLTDVERIEILRGPQGTLFGRNAEGGAVQYISKKPTGKFGARADASVGNFDMRRFVAHLDLPKFGGVSLKLSGLKSRREGYIENRPLGPGESLSHHEDFGMNDQKGLRIAALWEPLENFSAYYAYDNAEDEGTNYYTQRTGGRTPSEPAFCSVPSFAALCATPQSLAANIYTGTQAPEPARVDRSSLPMFVRPNTNDVKGHTLVLTWDAVENVQLKSLTGYRELEAQGDNNLAGAIAFVQVVPTSMFNGVGADVPVGTTGAVGGPYAAAHIDQRQFSQELQIIGSMDRFRYTGGLYYFNENLLDTRASSFSLAYVYLGQPGVLTPFATNLFALGATPTINNPSLQVYDAEATSYAAYFQGTYTPPVLNDRLEITTGLRYTKDKKEHIRTVFAGVPSNTEAPEFKIDRIDPSFTFAYNFSDGLHTYVRYATAYRAGGVWIRNKARLTSYKEEELTTWEIGVKTDLFDRRLRWNLAAYRSDVNDFQSTVQNLTTDPSSADVVNLDGITLSGIESEMTWAPVPSLRAALNYAFQHVDAPSQIGNLQGATIPFEYPILPKHQVSASIDWTIPVSQFELVPHISYAYQSDFYSTSGRPTFTDFETSSLKMVNARLTLQGISFGMNKLEISLWGRNLTQEDDYLFAFAAPTSDFTVAATPGGAAYPIPPRSYGIDLRYEF